MIDLCIVSYNTLDKLRRLLRSLEPFDPTLYNLYVADNGSTDGTREALMPALEFYKTKGIHFIFNENIGYAAACNQLASYGSGDVIALLNADVWLTNDDLRKIQRVFNTINNAAILGPKQRDEIGRITHGGIVGTLESPQHRGWMQPDTDDSAYRDWVECVTVSGSAYFIRRYVWDTLTQCKIYQELCPGAVGAFLPTPHYFEETWCSYHAHAHGFQVFYDGRVSIGHSWHASSPLHGEADKQFPISQAIFRHACQAHGIACN